MRCAGRSHRCHSSACRARGAIVRRNTCPTSALLPDVGAGGVGPQGRRCSRIEPYRHDGDIVDSSAIERHCNQEIAGLLGPVLACQRKYLLVLHVGGEAVTADHEDVPRLQGAALDLKLRIIAYADRPRYDISTWPGARLLRSEPALGNEFLHFRVIDRYLLDPVLANAVDSAVSGPYGGVMAIENKQNCDRGADQRAAPIAELFKPAIGADDAPLAVCQQSGPGNGNRHGSEVLDDGPARNVACRVAAHAVGHRPQ